MLAIWRVEGVKILWNLLTDRSFKKCLYGGGEGQKIVKKCRHTLLSVNYLPYISPCTKVFWENVLFLL